MKTRRQADPEKKLFGIGLLLFGSGLIWFHASWPGGIFTLHPLNPFDAWFRAEILFGAILAAYGLLLWRSATHNLCLANYIWVAFCTLALILCASKISEWAYFSHHQRGNSLLVDLEAGAIQLTMVICIVVFGGWWADSTYMHERFRECVRSFRFVK